MLQIKVRLDGLTPILMHNPAGMKPKSIGTGAIPSPEEEAEQGCYRLENKNLYIQTVAIRSSFIAAAGAFKIGRMGLKSQLSGIMRDINPIETIELKNNGKAITEYKIDIRRAVVQGQGVLRSRPRIDLPWSLSFQVYVDDQFLAKSQVPILEDVMNRAGSLIGIGDFRPGSPKNKSGWFGKYEVGLFEIVDEK